MMERTVVVLKPDAVERGLVGEILSRFERAGLRIAGSKTVKVSAGFVAQHYPDKEDYLRSVGEHTLEEYAKNGIDPKEIFETADPIQIGRKIREWNMSYLSQGSVVAVVLEGNAAIELVRKLVGKTDPTAAEPGTIRRDYSSDSFAVANREKRSVRNLMHASGSREDARYELNLWFRDTELTD